MLFGVFYTQLGVQGMEGIGELQNYLAPVLPYCAPSHILVLIVANRVILFLYRVHKKIPSGIDAIYSRLFCGTFIQIIFLQVDLTICLGHPHLSDLQTWEYQN
jgi:hypothetical protein